MINELWNLMFLWWQLQEFYFGTWRWLVRWRQWVPLNTSTWLQSIQCHIPENFSINILIIWEPREYFLPRQWYILVVVPELSFPSGKHSLWKCMIQLTFVAHPSCTAWNTRGITKSPQSRDLLADLSKLFVYYPVVYQLSCTTMCYSITY